MRKVSDTMVTVIKVTTVLIVYLFARSLIGLSTALNDLGTYIRLNCNKVFNIDEIIDLFNDF